MTQDSLSDVHVALLAPATEPDEPASSGTPRAHGGDWKVELQSILALALPTMVLTCSGQAMAITDQIYLGHLGDDELAGGALGNTYSNIMWFFLVGTTTALDTLGSRAVGGGNHAATVTWCVSSFLITSLLLIPLVIAQLFGNAVAKSCFGQSEQVARLVGIYCRMLIPGMWPMMWGIILTKYLQVQNHVAVPAVMSVITFVVNIALNSLFIPIFGFKGAALATTVSRVVYFILMVISLLVFETWRDRSPSPCEAEALVQVVVEGEQRPAARIGGMGSKVQHLWATRNKWEARQVWTYMCQQVKLAVAPSIVRKYLELAVPGGFMLMFEASALDTTTIFAARLGTVAVDAHSCMLLILDLTFLSVPFAVATASTIRVGNLLGAGEATTARLSGYISILIGTSFMAVCGVLVYTLRNILGKFFSNSPLIIARLATIAPMAALMQVSDGLMGTSQGVLRGCGHHASLMFFNFVGFWLCGLLLAFVLCFNANLGLEGLWWGLAIGWAITCCLNMVSLASLDWDQEMRAAQACNEDAAVVERRNSVARDDKTLGWVPPTLVEALCLPPSRQGSLLPPLQGSSAAIAIQEDGTGSVSSESGSEEPDMMDLRQLQEEIITFSPSANSSYLSYSPGAPAGVLSRSPGPSLGI